MTDQEIQVKIEAARNKNPKISKPIIKVRDIIRKIEEMGYLVKLTHYRYFGQKLLKNADIHVLIKAMKIMGNNVMEDCRRDGDFICNKGGTTFVEVSNPDNRVKVSAKSECSLSDNFVYSKASRLALYRVLDQLPDDEAKNLRKELEKMYLKFQIQVKDGDRWVDFDGFPFEDKEIAENEAEALNHETGKETRVVSVFE